MKRSIYLAAVVFLVIGLSITAFGETVTTETLIQEALNRAEKSIPVRDHTVSIGGEVIDERAV